MNMDIYKKLIEYRCFNKEELIELAGSVSSAEWFINNYLQKGYIERVRRNLYTVISLETLQSLANRFQIASHVSTDACISHHTAFEYYGYANQVFYDVYISSNSRMRPFEYDGYSYVLISKNNNKDIIHTNNGIRVTSIEQTVIDCICDLEKTGGLEEFIKCLTMVQSLNTEKLLNILRTYGYEQLYQKTGYILEEFKNELTLSDEFFKECEKRCSHSKTYLISNHKNFVLNKKWKIYVPNDLKGYSSEG